MADNSNFGFGKFVPGFDFLQNLAKGASQTIPQMPNVANWIAPTLNVEELDKRISDLKAVHFWLDQNAKALGATIQALEVQKMTLATLKGMNFNMGELADALKLNTADSVLGAKKSQPADKSEPAPTPEKSPAKKAAVAGSGVGAAGVVDPLQWWGALTQQFQQIASNAMKDAAAHTAKATARQAAVGMVKDGTKAATKAATKPGAKRATRKSAARKTSR